jgi:hypothetical protein
MNRAQKMKFRIFFRVGVAEVARLLKNYWGHSVPNWHMQLVDFMKTFRQKFTDETSVG